MCEQTLLPSDKFLLSFEEAAEYFHIGETKLRKLADSSGSSGWVINNGNRRLIKRVRLEEILLKSESI